MWVNTRYDQENYAALGLAPAAPTWGYPLSAVGEEIQRAGQRFYIIGQGLHAQAYYGSIYATATRAEIDALVARWRDGGVNALSVMEMELGGLVPAGPDLGRPVSCWDNGFPWSASRSWSVGQVCHTFDTSGVTRVYRRYVCDTAGVGAASGNGPTGTNATPNGITDGAAKWHYIGPAYQSYNEQFWTGDGTSAGFDYLMDACGRAGIYVLIRFDQWGTVFAHANAGYQLNGSAAGSGGNLANHRMVWPLDGTGGTPNILQAQLDHMDQWLTRVNSVNGKRYGDDHTLLGFDCYNEQGVAFCYYGSSDSASANTWDYLCKVGSTTPGVAEPVSAVVAWWDAAWLAWYQATYGSTPADDYDGKANTLPVFRYTGAMGPNVAARDRYYSGTGPWTERVARFLREMETGVAQAIKAHVASRSAHAMLVYGQTGWSFSATVAQADIADCHVYPSPMTTSGNYMTQAITRSGDGTGAGTGVTWSGGTLTVAFGVAPSRPLLVGQKIRVTQTLGGSWTGVVTVATIFTTTVSNDSFTATGVDDPVTIGATRMSFSAVLPTVDYNVWSFHAPTAGNTSETRMHYYDAASAPGVESDYDRLSGWPGQLGLGSYNYMRDTYIAGKPTICTELGERGLGDPQKGLYRMTYTLLDLLQGGSGAFHYAFATGDPTPVVGEHNIPGDGASWLDAIAMTLMARYVGRLPNEAVAHASVADMDALFSRATSTGPAWPSPSTFGQASGYVQFSPASLWHAGLFRRLRLALDGTSVPSAYAPSLPFGGWTNPDLADPATGLLHWWYDFGSLCYENAKIALIIGRIPADTGAAGPSPLPLPLSKLRVSTLDGLAWYGRVMWVSLDGSDLGVGKSALLTWCYPRAEGQVTRRFTVEAGPIGRVELLDGDYGSAQAGVVMRNGLEVQLTSPRALSGYRYARGAVDKLFDAWAYSGGNVHFNPAHPLTVLV